MTVQVGYLSEEAIEREAEALLAEYALARDVTLVPPIPADEILEHHLKLNLNFDYLRERLGIPMKGDAPDVFGALWFDSRQVFIDQRLDPEEPPLEEPPPMEEVLYRRHIDEVLYRDILDPQDRPSKESRLRLSLGHEIGHWRLHRHYLAYDPAPIVCQTSWAKKRVESQADHFASCLLMPKPLVVATWRERFGNTDCYIPQKNHLWSNAIFRNKPPIPGRARNRDEEVLENFVWPFANLFGVSPAAMRSRLERLGLLTEEICDTSSCWLVFSCSLS